MCCAHLRKRPPLQAEIDQSSPVFLVDHSACILCDRCSRACDEVKNNNVIGRTGKGHAAAIGFDLNDPMGESSCVQCGECMVSCPTSAITFKPLGKVKLPANANNVDVLSADELRKDAVFEGVPAKFLLWQEGLVVRRRVAANEVLCRQGDPGNTAFVMRKGRFQVTAYAPGKKETSGNLFNLLKHTPKNRRVVMQVDLTPADIILGEMTCLSGTPRTADVVALEEGEVWEVRRNVLDRIMRAPAQRERFERLYRSRAVDLVLRSSDLFHELPEEAYHRCVEFLRPRLSFVRVEPGQTIFNQGDWADAFYLVRLGHVRVGISQYGKETTVVYRTAGAVIGEIGLLAFSAEDAHKPVEEVDRVMGEMLNGAGENLSSALPAGQRTATCTAMDHLELAARRAA